MTADENPKSEDIVTEWGTNKNEAHSINKYEIPTFFDLH